MLSGQTIPQACQVASEVNLNILAQTAGISIHQAIVTEQKIPGTQVFLQPLPPFSKLNLSICDSATTAVNVD